MARIDPEEQDFDPDTFSPEDLERALGRGLELFDAGEYHAAHEEIEKCWLASEAGDADFFKGLIQAAICMHHLARDNVDGARKLYSGHRRLLGPFLPAHRGVDVAALLTEMQRVLGPFVRGGAAPFDPATRPRLRRVDEGR